MTRARPRRFTRIAAPLLPWAIHFVAVYSLQGLVCARGWSQLAGQTGMIGMTLLALVAVLLLGHRAWRRMRAGQQDDDVFAARTALHVSALACVAIVFTAIPLWLLAPCE